MPQNKLTDLNNHLFAELERLGDEGLTGDKLEEELGRAKGIAQISSQVISNAPISTSKLRNCCSETLQEARSKWTTAEDAGQTKRSPS